MERDLVARAAGGDQEAFEALVRLSAGRLFATAYRILRDHHLAEDALQQTLVTIWDELPRLRDPDRSTPGPTGSSFGPASRRPAASGGAGRSSGCSPTTPTPTRSAGTSRTPLGGSPTATSWSEASAG